MSNADPHSLGGDDEMPWTRDRSSESESPPVIKQPATIQPVRLKRRLADGNALAYEGASLIPDGRRTQ
jgi:hypothetical protein